MRLAGRSGRPRVLDVWSGSYAGAGYPKTLVSSHVRCLVVERGRRWRLLIARSAERLCAECREARAASPAATGCGGGR